MERRVAGNTVHRAPGLKRSLGKRLRWKEEGRSDRGIGKGKGMTRMSKQLWEESRKGVLLKGRKIGKGNKEEEKYRRIEEKGR